MATSNEANNQTYDVFISSKSEDYKSAQQICDYLIANNLSVFFADTELKKLGNADYSKVIDDALDCSKHMIVFGSKIEYIESEWVRYEWDTFFNEKKSGRKKGNILTVLDGIAPKDLPLALRNVQSFTIDNYEDSILNYLKQGSSSLFSTYGKHHKFRDNAEWILLCALLSIIIAFFYFSLNSKMEKKFCQRRQDLMLEKRGQIEAQIKLVAGQMDSVLNAAAYCSSELEGYFFDELQDLQFKTIEYENPEKTAYHIVLYPLDMDYDLIDYVNCMKIYNRDFEIIDSLLVLLDCFDENPSFHCRNVSVSKKNQGKHNNVKKKDINIDELIGYNEVREGLVIFFCDTGFWITSIILFISFLFGIFFLKKIVLETEKMPNEKSCIK